MEKKGLNWPLVAVLVAGGFLLVGFGGRCLSSNRDAAHAAAERGAVLLDVRTADEFASGHLPGALNIPVDELEKRISEVPRNDAGVVVYCRSGARSARATKLLQEHGIIQVVDLGPMSAW